MKYFKSIGKIFCALLFGVAVLFAFCGSFNIFAFSAKLPIICFEKLPDIILTADAMDDFSTVSEALESLYKKYPSIKVNETDDTVSVDNWEIQDESLIEKYNNKIPGEYSFLASVSSTKYDIYTISTSPTIKIIILEPEKISSFELETLSDIKISTNDIDGFETKEAAEKSILEKYKVAGIKDSKDFIEISRWEFSGNEYSPSKSGVYEFSAVFCESAKYDVSKCSLKIKLIIINEKKKITNFESFNKITLNEISPAGWENKADAEKTLLSLYKSISVNQGEGTVPVISWSLSGGNYDSSRNGTYFFMPKLGISDIYDTQNLNVSPSPIEVAFNIPYGYASIYLYSSDGDDISNASLKLENSKYSFYGESDKNGGKIFYAPEGEYEISAYYDGEKILKTILIKKDKTTYLKIKFGTADTEKTSTSKKVSETTSGTTQSTTQKETQNLWQDGGMVYETKTSKGLYIKVEADTDYLSDISKDFAENEFKDILNSVLSLNFTKTAKKAKSAVEKAFTGLEANILPINFSSHKDFAFPVKVSLFVGNEIFQQGEYFLYYYNPQTGDIENSGKALLDENGFLCFEISHCSDYFVSDKELIADRVNSVVLSESNAQSKQISFLNIENQNVNTTFKDKNEISSNVPVKIIFQEKNSKDESSLLLLINIAFILFAVLYLKRNAK